VTLDANPIAARITKTKLPARIDLLVFFMVKTFL